MMSRQPARQWITIIKYNAPANYFRSTNVFFFYFLFENSGLEIPSTLPTQGPQTKSICECWNSPKFRFEIRSEMITQCTFLSWVTFIPNLKDIRITHEKLQVRQDSVYRRTNGERIDEIILKIKYSTVSSHIVKHMKLLTYEAALLWSHNGHNGVSNHQTHECLLNRPSRPRSKKISKLSVTGLFAGNSPETVEFPAQMASNAENVSIWWRHHGKRQLHLSHTMSAINYNFISYNAIKLTTYTYSILDCIETPSCDIRCNNGTCGIIFAQTLIISRYKVVIFTY